MVLCVQELVNRLAAGEEAIYEALPDLAAAVGRPHGDRGACSAATQHGSSPSS